MLDEVLIKHLINKKQIHGGEENANKQNFKYNF